MNYLKASLLTGISFIFSYGILSAQAVEKGDFMVAQQQANLESKASLILNVGAGFPTGDFADSESGGAAKNGFGIGVELQYEITSSFYIGAMYRNQTNPVDDESMKMSLSVALVPGVRVQSLSANNWNLNSYMLGMGTITPVNNHALKVFTKVMIGLCHANSPSIQMTLTDGVDQISINQLSAKANNFAALFGAGFRIHLSDFADLQFTGDYFISHLEFDDVKVSVQGQGNFNAGKISQDVDMFSLSAGLIFKL